MAQIKKATMEEFDIAFRFIEALWDYNTYNKEEMKKVYKKILSDDTCFAIFCVDNEEYCGFCHGDFFQTFWMEGLTCYISGLVVKENLRGKGYGTALVDYVKQLAQEKGCKALTLESGIERKKAHVFYEKYGFEKSCYGFEMLFKN